MDLEFFTFLLLRSFFLCLSLCLSLPFSLSLSVSLSFSFFPSISLCFYSYVSLCLTVFLFVCLSVCLSVFCLFCRMSSRARSRRRDDVFSLSPLSLLREENGRNGHRDESSTGCLPGYFVAFDSTLFSIRSES